MIPALIAGAAGLLGGVIANRSSARQAEKQMDFQEEMSNTSYQRAVEDMRKAGINPMLSAKVGGASTPPGAAAHVQDLGAAAVSSAQSGVGMQQALASVDKTKADTRLADAQADEVKARTLSPDLYSGKATQAIHNIMSRTDLTNEQKWTELARRDLIKTQRNLGEVNLDLAATSFGSDVERRKAMSELARLAVPEARAGAKFFGSDLGEESPWLKRLIEVIRGVSSGSSAVRQWRN